MSRISPDAQYAAVIAALTHLPGVTVANKRGFGYGGLMVGGKLFATIQGQTLLLKLPANRVAGLISNGDGAPFDAGKGRPMREWIAVQCNERIDWLALSREALAFVKSAVKQAP